MSDELSRQARKVSQVFKQLSNPARLMALCCMVQKERTVTELVSYTGASQSWVSQFLASMKSYGLVASRRQSTFVYYRISDLKLRMLMKAIYRVYCKDAK